MKMTSSQAFAISSHQSTKNWYALYTRPNFEKKVEQELSVMRISSFLPVKKVWRIWSDRRKLLNEPLFPSYVFVHADSKERYLSLQARGVVRMLTCAGQPSQISENEIEAIRRIAQSEYPAEAFPYLRAGDHVEIAGGPLAGLRGFVVEQRRSSYFVISIDGLAKSLAISIDARLLKRINKG
jgi:transcription antitermination factor NusG